MRADDSIAKPTRPTPRRVAWGSLLADAPWDGRPRATTPILVPATVAGRASPAEVGPPAVGPGATPRSRKRVPLGALLANAPWAARPITPPDFGPIAAAV